MNDPLPEPDLPLDRLVRARLERDAHPDRAAGLWRRALKPRSSFLAWAPRLAAIAAVLLIAGLIFWPGGQARATPAEVVERAYRVHSLDDADRLYRLEVELPPAFAARFPRINGHAADVWTRGDRFRVEPGPGGGVWGQDLHGRVWIAPTPKAGARFDADEIPAAMRIVLKLRAVYLPELLSELRGRCELKRSDAGPGIYRVEATRNVDAGTLARATIDMDALTNAVLRLDLWRELPGGDEGRLHLTFQKAGRQPDDHYNLEGNLEAGGVVLDRTRPGLRLGLLARHHLTALLGE